LLCIQM